MRSKFVILFFAALMSMHFSAQTSTAPDPAAADKAYAARDWAASEPQYSALVSQQPENPRFWYRLGVSARSNKHLDIALDAFKKAKSLGVGNGLPPSLADYEIATTYAGMGKNSLALESLKSSAGAGFMQTSRLTSDGEWDALRSDDQFLASAKLVQHNAAPCDDAEFKQFDFWIGDWQVASAPDGHEAGSSHISKEMSGCVVWENWTSAGLPYAGKSYNAYNSSLKRWEQFWVDNSQGMIFFYGNLKDGVMDFWTDEIPQPSGPNMRRHLQFFNLAPDTVRQFSQRSTDGGKTWTVEYDFTYRRRKT